MKQTFQIKPATDSDKEYVKSVLENSWGSVDIISHGKRTNALELPSFLAIENGKNIGLITYHIRGDMCEIVTLDSSVQGKGVGIALINAVIEEANKQRCKKVWLITTNDNMHALSFYQKRGFRLSALYPNAIEEARKLKPEIPLIGNDNIPLRDEIELSIAL